EVVVAEHGGDLCDRPLPAGVRQLGCAGDHEQVRDPGEVGEDVLAHAVGEVSVLLVPGEVREGEHREAYPFGGRRRRGFPRGPRQPRGDEQDHERQGAGQGAARPGAGRQGGGRAGAGAAGGAEGLAAGLGLTPPGAGGACGGGGRAGAGATGGGEGLAGGFGVTSPGADVACVAEAAGVELAPGRFEATSPGARTADGSAPGGFSLPGVIAAAAGSPRRRSARATTAGAGRVPNSCSTGCAWGRACG